jgi:hypothetical protein
MGTNKESFLNLNNIEGANKDQLLQMRKILFNSLVQNAKREERKGMYLVSLAIFSEFERLTRHITDSDITKN